MTITEIQSLVRNVPDFPVKGIQFKDITTILKNPEAIRFLRNTLADMYRGKGITQVVGLESRGFIMGAALAMEIGAGFVLIRKPGKLPSETVQIEYCKEYGKDSIHIHKDALNENDVVLLHDDLLATGGTMEAAIKLVKKMGVKKIYVNCLIELDTLNGRKMLDEDVEINTLIHY